MHARILPMGRWEPNARERLQQAALELFLEHGFEGTTVLQIAERAGLTERTFFRHFTDKREVLFAGSNVLTDSMTRAIESADAMASPMQAVAAGLRSIGELIPSQRDFVRARSLLIESNPELRERERNKLAGLSESAADALRRRGVEDSTAMLTAEIGMAAFRVAFARWIGSGDDRTLNDCITETLGEIAALKQTQE